MNIKNSNGKIIGEIVWGKEIIIKNNSKPELIIDDAQIIEKIKEKDLDTIVFLLFLGCVLLSFIMNIYISHQIIKKVYPKYGDWITVFNVLTLGFFRSISLFLVRNK